MAINPALKAVEDIRSAMSVRRIFGQPFERNGLTILPVARIDGAGGVGSAGARSGTPRRLGGAFRVTSRPLGVFVIDKRGARWVPVPAPSPISLLLAVPAGLLQTILRSTPRGRVTPVAGSGSRSVNSRPRR